MNTKALRVFLFFGIATGGIVAIIAALASLQWRYVHDSPLMIYAGWLVSQGVVPYRDFFDMNMPGTYLIMWGMGKIFGWGDVGFRIFDMCCLASISTSTYLWLRPAGKLSAVAAPTAFALWYLSFGPAQSLQREYLALVPFTVMLATSATGKAPISVIRILFSGALAGLIFAIKPQLLLLSLPLFLVIGRQDQPPIRPWLQLVIFGTGVCITIGAIVLYLITTNSLRPFLKIALNYWPLYTHLTGGHTPISGFQRVLYIIKETCGGILTFYTLIAMVGLLVLYDTGNNQHLLRLLVGLIVAAAICPAIAGQFWRYHWIPFHYLALCAASMSAIAMERRSIVGIIPIALLTFTLVVHSAKIADDLAWRWKGNRPEVRVKNGVPDEIAQFLRSHLKAGDTVQPLDWTGGAVHGMLMARATLATRFMYDFHFYHHINSPFVSKLRREFLNELDVKKPRFIIQVLENKPWPTGTNTTRDFPELQSLLDQCYEPAYQGATYRILEIRHSMPNHPVHPTSLRSAAKPVRWVK
ncbi:MAG TPA: hypothetical protein PKN04_11405 [bacterium]|nr:hypothetical protein [bacterium]HNT66378.1 hypothetical protein [bacterium]